MKMELTPSFSDIKTGKIAVEGTGTIFRTISTRKTVIRVPGTMIQIITHVHIDQMPAILETAFVPDIIAYKAKVIYRQYGLRPRIIPWLKYRRTFHYNRGEPVFSSAMEFSDFVVIGESAEQHSLVERYSTIYPHGVIVRTPKKDTEEKPVAVPSGWFFADNTAFRAKTPQTLQRICPSLLDMDLDERIREAVLELHRSA